MPGRDDLVLTETIDAIRMVTYIDMPRGANGN